MPLCRLWLSLSESARCMKKNAGGEGVPDIPCLWGRASQPPVPFHPTKPEQPSLFIRHKLTEHQLMAGAAPSTGDMTLNEAVPAIPKLPFKWQGVYPEKSGGKLFHCYGQKLSLGLTSGSWRLSSIKYSKKIQIQTLPVPPHL